MLIDIYKHVIDNKEQISEKLNINLTKRIHEKARKIWNNFPDEYHNAELAGIDSSWNLIPYHGFYLYAVDGVSVKSDGSLLTDVKYEIGIDTLEFKEGNNIIYNPSIMLSSKGMTIEYQLIKESLDKVDLVLVDGSLQARIYDNRMKRSLEFYKYARDLKRDDVIFISKRSESRSVLRGSAGDIYYFDHATSVSGYSDPYYDKNITIVYARLSDNLPCLKIEFGVRLDKDQVLDRLLSIKEQCISGYPYVLNIAHDTCKISDEDMKNIENLLGIIEVKGREVLEY
ncbi:MAG: hypothetical protein KatS3mg003_0555 [Candidatus Nitrosocaldaceae archaeon]|nr:MAG: hypothetical protein KatS3mg003_0555 [Candidatus Nitrosocaldaceae archaeon]